MIDIKLETITPEIAEKYLKVNVEKNRPVKRRHVDSIIDAMDNGDWMQNGDTIKFQKANGDGIEHLIDGQHRLHAIIRRGEPVDIFVARGLEPETFMTIDGGSKRTAADALAIAGYKQSTTLAAAARLLVNFKDDHTFTLNYKTVPTPAIINMIESQPRIVDSVSLGHKGRYLVPGSQLVFLHYLTSRDNPDLALEFITKVSEGVSMVKGDPILTFRERMLRYRAANLRLRRQLQLGLLFKTWNYHYRGEKIEKLRFAKDEGFPILEGYDRKKMFGSDYPELPEKKESKKNNKQGKLFDLPSDGEGEK